MKRPNIYLPVRDVIFSLVYNMEMSQDNLYVDISALFTPVGYFFPGQRDRSHFHLWISSWWQSKYVAQAVYIDKKD